MTYPKSLFRNDGGNWVERTAHDADEEAQIKAQGFSDLVIGNPTPKPAPAPFFPPVPEKAKAGTPVEPSPIIANIVAPAKPKDTK